ncbi:hypothetical protein [Clostridium aciditolerans]|uniref:Uncharacterized protein n=1 Tax=Clostridium aciditolerans TaxID=339861 RepID=A0A934M2G7_9CLOT|nr:hypothetical protein [Clostridium aciditolerans]MBI6871920.1 hypothetical protein [Clostridium aciditolerans]
MDKIYLNIIKFLKTLKRLLLSLIKYCSTFFQRKETIDNMYTSIIQNKTIEIKSLEKELNIVHSKNIKLKREIEVIKNSLNKKNVIISNLQDLITKRVD